MKQIIQITQEVIGNQEVNSVNARDLWSALEIKQEFSSWIKRQIKALGLEINVDFIRFDKKVKTAGSATGTQRYIEYIITTDTAKHISMASRTAKGKEVRDYFIACEKSLHVKDPLNTLATVMTAFIKAQSDHNATMLELVKTIATQNKNQLSLYLSPEQLSNIKIEVSKTARAAARVHNISILNAVKETFTSLNAQMGVATYYQIPASAYDEAIEILKEWRELKDNEFEKLTKNTYDEDIIY